MGYKNTYSASKLSCRSSCMAAQSDSTNATRRWTRSKMTWSSGGATGRPHLLATLLRARAWSGCLVVTHVGRANHGAVVLIVKDAEAPHAGPQLVCVLARAKPYADAVPKEQLLVGKGVELRVARLVAVVIRVLAYSQRCGWLTHEGRAARQPLCLGDEGRHLGRRAQARRKPPTGSGCATGRAPDASHSPVTRQEERAAKVGREEGQCHLASSAPPCGWRIEAHARSFAVSWSRAPARDLERVWVPRERYPGWARPLLATPCGMPPAGGT